MNFQWLKKIWSFITSLFHKPTVAVHDSPNATTTTVGGSVGGNLTINSKVDDKPTLALNEKHKYILKLMQEANPPNNIMTADTAGYHIMRETLNFLEFMDAVSDLEEFGLIVESNNLWRLSHSGRNTITT
jgi:hypothetical protein